MYKHKNIKMSIRRFKTLKLFLIAIVIAIAFFNIYKYAMIKVRAKENDDITTNMLIIQKKIKLMNGEMKVNGTEESYIGTKITELNNDEIKNQIEQTDIKEEELEKLYILSSQDLEDMGILEELKKVNDNEYIINYKEVDVIYIKGVNVEDKKVYRLSEITSNSNEESKEKVPDDSDTNPDGNAQTEESEGEANDDESSEDNVS